NGHRISKLVHLHHVGDHFGSGAHPDGSASQNQGEQHQTRKSDLPVALAENKIGVAFVPFTSGAKIKLTIHVSVRSIGAPRIAASAGPRELSEFSETGRRMFARSYAVFCAPRRLSTGWLNKQNRPPRAFSVHFLNCKLSAWVRRAGFR